MKRIINAFGLLILVANCTARAESMINYPEEYRSWTHVKSLTLHDGHPLENPFKGIHHIYANDAGVEGIKTGRYKDGASIVFDLLENRSANNASSEGKRILIGVMIKDSQKFEITGGWGFEAWSGNSRTTRLTNDNGTSCFSCHLSQKKRDYVFSQWRH